MRLQILCENRMGIAHEILEVLVEYRIDLHGIESGPTGQIYLHIPNLEFDDFQQLMPRLRRIGGVTDVSTVVYMPLEREQQELQTLVRTLPEPIISIDPRGYIVFANRAARHILRSSGDELRERPLRYFLKGFNPVAWLNQENPEHRTVNLQLKNQPYLCDIFPISLPDENEDGCVSAGAVLTFKSPERLGRQVNALQKGAAELDMIIADSPEMKKVLRQARKMSQLDAPLLICGETGTGKELLARACHINSLRGSRPFLALNCASLPEDVAETELFGMAAGTAPGRTEIKGIFEQAEGGTLLLDEVAEFPMSLQGKFLRLIQNGTFRKVGAEQEKSVNVRIICSTQKNLLSQCEKGLFRADLYYRLNVLTLNIPPLRERPRDILPLADHFITRFAQTQGRFIRYSKASERLLRNYHWPGNVRQLENTLLKAVTLSDNDILEPEHIVLPAGEQESDRIQFSLDDNGNMSLDEAVKHFEAELLRRLYPAYPSSRLLGKKLSISHTAIANKLREYGIGRK